MTDYARARLNFAYSAVSDFSNPQSKLSLDLTSTPTGTGGQWIEVATGGTTITLSTYSAIAHIVVHNSDTTNFVTVGWTDSASTANAPVVPASTSTLPAVLMIPDVDPSAADLVLTADTAACKCWVFISGTI